MCVAVSFLKRHAGRRFSYMHKYPNPVGTQPSFHRHWKQDGCFLWMARKSTQSFIVSYVLTCIGLFLLNKIHLLFVTLPEQNCTLWRFDLLSDFMVKLWANHRFINYQSVFDWVCDLQRLSEAGWFFLTLDLEVKKHKSDLYIGNMIALLKVWHLYFVQWENINEKKV